MSEKKDEREDPAMAAPHASPSPSQTHSVGLIVGSVSEPSLNRRFASALEKLAPAAGLEVTGIPIGDLPFYGTQYNDEFPASGIAFKRALDSADGLLIVTPEYNRSIPGVLKNAIDWASRPVGANSFPGKPVAVTGASKGVISTAVAQNHLKAILIAQGAAVLGAPEAYIRVSEDFYADDGTFASEGTRTFLTGFLRNFHTLIARYV